MSATLLQRWQQGLESARLARAALRAARRRLEENGAGIDALRNNAQLIAQAERAVWTSLRELARISRENHYENAPGGN